MNTEHAILKHFKPEEFNCKCCGKNQMRPEFLGMLDRARDFTPFPFVINSGWRCPAHNLEVGGSRSSTHLTGRAADIAVKDDTVRGHIIAALLKAGFRRLGIAKTFIHVDCDPVKPGAVWLY